MTDKKERPKEPKPIEISSFSKELLLIIFGALIGALANQVFFKENKDYEMKVELQKDLLKEQYQYLNRILQFTHRYEITTAVYYAQSVQIVKYIEEGTKKVVRTDTIGLKVQDSASITLPSFILKADKRKQFQEDIVYIKSNKDKIDHVVYNKFEELLELISENPIPNSSDKGELEKSKWNNKGFQDKWQKRKTELYYLTYGKLY